MYSGKIAVPPGGGGIVYVLRQNCRAAGWWREINLRYESTSVIMDKIIESDLGSNRISVDAETAELSKSKFNEY
jgi:hypothetical protein